MQAFHNDQKIKDKYVNRVKEHIKLDNLVRGATGENNKGCAVACTLDMVYDHSRYPIELGIPEWLARVEDRLFEGMTLSKSKTFPNLFLEAINVGSNLEKIKVPFLIFVVESTLEHFDHKKYPDVKKAIDGVLKELKKKKINLDKLRKARDAAAAVYAAANASL